VDDAHMSHVHDAPNPSAMPHIHDDVYVWRAARTHSVTFALIQNIPYIKVLPSSVHMGWNYVQVRR